MKRFGGWVLFGFLATLVAAPGAGAEVPAARNPPLTVLRVTPAGEDVPPGRQIVIQFDRPLVPLGHMQRETVPVRVEPGLACQWRWLDQSALACELPAARALQPATRYDVVIGPGFQGQDGSQLPSEIRHRFVTERPRLLHAWLRNWLSPERPLIQLVFNQPVTAAAVEERFRLAAGAGRQVAVLAEPEPQEQVDQGSAWVWLVSPRGDLGPDAAVELRVSPGLVSQLGAEPGVEKRAVLSLHTFPALRFLGVACTDNRGRSLHLPPGATAGEPLRCNPVADIGLLFSAPVMAEEVQAQVHFSPQLGGERAGRDAWAGQSGYSRLSSQHRREEKYPVWLPPAMEPLTLYRLRSAAGKLQDEFGRPLRDGMEMRFSTDHLPPDFSLAEEKAVLEKAARTDLALRVTNLKSVSLRYDRLTAAGKLSGERRLNPPRAEDRPTMIGLGVREMLEGSSGVIRGTVKASSPAVRKAAAGRDFFAQVTPFCVHVKAGHFNTLIWVTDLTDGKPVPDAAVRIYRDTYQDLSPAPERLAEARTDQRGIAELKGLQDLDPRLEHVYAYEPGAARLFVRVERGADMALLPLDDGFRVDAYQASRYTVFSSAYPRYGHLRAWGTSAQGVYRAGDNVQYKFYVRNQDNRTLVPAPREGYSLKVLDPLGKTVHEVRKLALSEFGACSGQFEVPRGGAVGWYRFELSAAFYPGVWEPLRVLVSDFTPAPFRVETELSATLFAAGQQVQVTTRATLHSGGPFTHAPGRISATLVSEPFRPENPVTEGFHFETEREEEKDRLVVHQIDSSLNDQGLVTTGFALPESDIAYGRLIVEGAVSDERGRRVSHAAAAVYAGRDRLVGLRPVSWLLRQGEPARFETLVVDADGQPISGVAVEVLAERRETRAARVKGAGETYLTQYSHEWVEVARCRLTSEGQPKDCRFVPGEPGIHRVTASIADSQGKHHRSGLQQWVAGAGTLLWEESPDKALALVPEKTRYRVGETARYLVQNPFPAAIALITVERYGILRHWVQALETGTPVVSFEVERDFLPGCFVSVVVMSPRVAEAGLEAAVDLARPDYRMGYARMEVWDPDRALAVQVVSERGSYRPRERVKVRLQAALPSGSRPEPVEVAVAVLDESVLDLLERGKEDFDPYRGFYALEGLDLENYNLLARLVSRQLFARKGVSAGGDGGLEISLRSVFRYVGYWNPSLRAAQDGTAHFEFEAPDNLTGWRVLAMAVTPTDRMGLGETRFVVNRPTELRPVMPNQVTEGDRFMAGFAVLNRTPAVRRLQVEIRAEGALEGGAPGAPAVLSRELTLAPFKRETLWLPVVTAAEGALRFTAAAGDAQDRDALLHTLAVRPRRTLQRAATFGALDAETVLERVRFPDGIRLQPGGLTVTLAPTLMAQLEGAFRYLKGYPYACWEQILSRAVMASVYRHLRDYLPGEFRWEESADLPRETLARAGAFQAPNGGMCFYLPADDRVSPYLSAYSALAFEWLASRGDAVPPDVRQQLHGYLRDLLRRDGLVGFQTPGVAFSVRATALAALAAAGAVQVSELHRLASHLPEMSVFGRAQFLSAALRFPGTETLRQEALTRILAHAVESSGQLSFNESLERSHLRILDTPLRANGAVLSALSALARTPEGAALAGEMPQKLARAVLQGRRGREHWENTQENVFCLNGLVDYALAREAQRPDMELEVSLEQAAIGRASFRDRRDRPVKLFRGFAPGDPGRETDVTIRRQGKGAAYYELQLAWAKDTPETAPIQAGIEIRREYRVERNGGWQLAEPLELVRGERIRVDLLVSVPTERHFVVVEDPVPGGLEPLNPELATTPGRESGDPRRSAERSPEAVSHWRFYHQELRHDVARFYSEVLPAGSYPLSYTAQAVAPGEFQVLAAHAEEMYAPEVFGRSGSARLVVKMGR